MVKFGEFIQAGNMAGTIRLSLVLPCYFEEGNIEHIYREVSRACDGLPSVDPEFIFVDDGSRDRTFEKIRALAEKDRRVKGIRFSRNFGHQTALLAGLKESAGELVIMMDSDGQHPPSLIPRLLEEHKKGFDIVNTRRESTQDTKFFKRLTSRWYYRIINSMSEIRIETSSSDFRLMTRKALDAFLEMDEHSRFTRGMISWIGFRQSIIPFHAGARHAGKTKYSLKKMLGFGLYGITSFSARPLRISFVFGLVILFLGLIYGIFAIVMYFLDRTGTGWTSLLITMLVLCGVQLISIGIIGEYIARIFTEAKSRPHYFIQDRC